MAHFVLIHGMCHGAWCWAKLKTLLNEAGHQVTALDMTGCGINLKSVKDVKEFEDYCEPLLEFMGSVCEQVILVGHSIGGMCLAFAMEKFPEKVSVAVYVTAFMPDTKNLPSYVMEKFNEITPQSAFIDSKIEQYGSETLILSGPEFLAKELYTSSPREDLELAKTLMRQSSLFAYTLSKAKKFTETGYGSVKRVFVITGDDKIETPDFQKWMIQNSPVDKVLKIEGSDHMFMFSKPKEICDILREIANTYA